MDVFVLIISRLVPMLFVASAALVVGRVVFDKTAPRSRPAAVALFAAIVLGSMACLVPSMLRLGMMVSAVRAYHRGDWRAVDASLSELRARGARMDRLMTRDWITAALNAGDNAKAERLILEHLRPAGKKVEAEPQEILMLGVARYRARRFREAQRTLQAVPNAKDTDLFIRDYYLGRLAESRGDCASAVPRFQSALAAQPKFEPARYHLVRCTMLMHGAANDTIPPDREFHVLFIRN